MLSSLLVSLPEKSQVALFRDRVSLSETPVPSISRFFSRFRDTLRPKFDVEVHRARLRNGVRYALQYASKYALRRIPEEYTDSEPPDERLRYTLLRHRVKEPVMGHFLLSRDPPTPGASKLYLLVIFVELNSLATRTSSDAIVPTLLPLSLDI